MCNVLLWCFIGSSMQEVNELTPVTEMKWLLKPQQLAFLQEKLKTSMFAKMNYRVGVANMLNISAEIVNEWYKNHRARRTKHIPQSPSGHNYTSKLEVQFEA